MNISFSLLSNGPMTFSTSWSSSSNPFQVQVSHSVIPSSTQTSISQITHTMQSGSHVSIPSSRTSFHPFSQHINTTRVSRITSPNLPPNSAPIPSLTNPIPFASQLQRPLPYCPYRRPRRMYSNVIPEAHSIPSNFPMPLSNSSSSSLSSINSIPPPLRDDLSRTLNQVNENLTRINDRIAATSRMPSGYTNPTSASASYSSSSSSPSRTIHNSSPPSMHPPSAPFSSNHYQSISFSVSPSQSPLVSVSHQVAPVMTGINSSSTYLDHLHHHHHHHQVPHLHVSHRHAAVGSGGFLRFREYPTESNFLRFREYASQFMSSHSLDPRATEIENHPFAASTTAINALVSEKVGQKLKDLSSSSSSSSQPKANEEETVDVPTCAICLSDFSMDEMATYMPCDHPFHKECLLPWLNKQNTCPTCRFEIETNDPEYNRIILRKRALSARKEQRRRARQTLNSRTASTSSASANTESHPLTTTQSTTSTENIVDLTGQSNNDEEIVDLTSVTSDSEIEFTNIDDDDEDEEDEDEEGEEEDESFLNEEDYEFVDDEDNEHKDGSEEVLSEYSPILPPELLASNSVASFLFSGPQMYQPVTVPLPQVEDVNQSSLPLGGFSDTHSIPSNALLINPPIATLSPTDLLFRSCCLCGSNVPMFAFACGHAFHPHCWRNYVSASSYQHCPRCNVVPSISSSF